MATKSPSDKHKTSHPKKRRAGQEIKTSRFSRVHLIIFGLVFAVIGGFAIWRAFAINPDPRIIIDDGVDGCTSSMTCPPRTVPVGHTSQLSWNWDRAYRRPTYCNDNFSGGHHEIEYGPFAHTFNGGGTFYWTVNCYVSDPSDFDEVTMQFNVIPPPTCSPGSQTVYTNQAASLVAGYGNGSYTWSAPGGNPPSGSGYNFYPAYAATGAHTVTVTSFGMSTNCTVNVINPPPGIPSVVLNPHTATINQGQSITISWTNNPNTTDCPGASPAGWTSGNHRVNSSATVSPSATTTYSLTCFNSDRTRAATDTSVITVRGTTAQRPTVRLEANPASIAYNGYSYLQWSSTNATTCSASWTGSHGTSGTQQVGRLTRTTTYSITCTGAGGSGSASATVRVGAPPSNCPPNCPTPPPPAAPTEELPPPEPIVSEEPTEPKQPACRKPNHLVDLIFGGLAGELISLIKHTCK